MSIRIFRIILLILVLLTAVVYGQTPKKNVLFLMADDFNHWLNEIGYYPQSLTPNLDKLAGKGILFTDAHCPSPVCNPSRNAIWSGYRPITTGIMSNGDGFVREKKGFENIVTMHQYFKQHGYYAYGAGKLWHAAKMGPKHTDAKNWSDIYRGGTGSPGGRIYLNKAGLKWSAGEFDLMEAGDTKMAHHIADLITNYTKSEQKDKPFFIGCGFFRPHLPWNCHKKFYDLFAPKELQIPKGYKENDLDDVKDRPNGMDHHRDILRSGGIKKWKEGIRAYLACMAYADYNAGIVLDALEKSPYKDNTIVLFMGDHGWHLGEKDRWSKHAVFDQANHTTLIIYDPSAKGNGKKCTKVVSMQDLYPTLVDLCGLPENKMIEGGSIAPLLDNPKDKNWDKPVFMSYRGTHYIKTNQWRFIDQGDASQLYHTAVDPYEWDNLYGKPEHEQITAKLKEQIAQFKRESKAAKEKLLQK